MVNREQLTVVCPFNDGESKTIIDICRRLGVDVRVSAQPWGATLDREPAENMQDLKKIIAVVEMPSIVLEEELGRQGHTVLVVDHHHYPNWNMDRRRALSSLEQIAEILGYSLTRWEQGVAINDRAYIFGLLDAGYAMDEILALRRFDLESQGVPPERIDAVREALKTAPVKAGITVLRLDFVNAGFAQDFLVLENPTQVRDLLVLGGNPIRKVQFYGDPEKVEKLADIGEWTGGGTRSKFWGTNNPDLPEIFRRLGIELGDRS